MKIFKLLKDKELIRVEAWCEGYEESRKKYVKILEKREAFLKEEHRRIQESQKVCFLNRLKNAEKEKENALKNAEKERENLRKVNEMLGERIKYFLNVATNLQNAREYFQMRGTEDLATANKILSEFEKLAKDYKNMQEDVRKLLMDKREL